jgi:hypothetical protein
MDPSGGFVPEVNPTIGSPFTFVENNLRKPKNFIFPPKELTEFDKFIEP